MHRQRLLLRAWARHAMAPEVRPPAFRAAGLNPAPSCYNPARLLHDSRALSTQSQALAARSEEVEEHGIDSQVTISTSELSTDLQRAQERQKLDFLLHKMSDGVQRTGRILIDDLNRTLNLLKSFSSCTTTQALLLIRSCGTALVDEPPLQRKSRVEDIWNFFETSSSLNLDSSHYNALLQAKIDNGETDPPTDFLALMENRGVVPNRVTFQRLVDLFCHQNNVAQALTVLEHMKAQGLAINEKVFQSLIIGHCKAGDLEQAKEIMDMMKESGLEVGTEGHLLYILGLVENGKPWAEIKDVMEKNLREDDITFHDSDFMRVVLALSKRQDTDDAIDVLQSMPRRSGFFQETRNMIPQLVFADALEVALELFKTIVVSEDSKADSGMFFNIALARHKTSWDRLKPLMDKQFEENYDRPARYLEVCAQLGLVDYGKEMLEHFKEAYGEDKLFDPEVLGKHCRQTLMKALTGQDIVNYCGNLRQIGLPIPTYKFHKDFIERYCDAEPSSSIANTTDIFHSAGGQSLRWGFIANCSLMVYLNRETPMKFLEAAYFAVSRMKNTVTPRFFFNSLARSYLGTSDIECYLIFLENAKLTDMLSKTDRKDTYENVLASLEAIHRLSHRYRDNQSADEVVGEVLTAMLENKLELPESFADSLRCIVKDEPVLEVIDKLVALKDDPIDQDGLNRSMLQRKDGLLRRLKQNSKSTGQVTDFKKMSTKDLVAIHEERMQSEQPLHRGIMTAMFERYFQEGRHEAALGLVIACKGEFIPRYVILNAVFISGIENGRSDDLLKAVFALIDKNKAVPMNLIEKLILNLLDPADHDKLLSLLKYPGLVDATKDEFQTHRFAKLVEKMQIVKSKEELSEITNAMTVNGIALNASVVMSLVTGSLEEAVSVFERTAEDTTTLIGKSSLYKRLILEEKVDLMQRVLNTSSRILGEQSAMYDLAKTFLEVGKVTQASKLLSCTGVSYNKAQVNRMLENLGKVNPEALDSVAVVTRNIVGCNRNHIFAYLIEQWKEEPTKIEELWLVMQDEDYVPSNGMKLKMSDILMSGNRTVPFDVSQLKMD